MYNEVESWTDNDTYLTPRSRTFWSSYG